ncbi:MAG: 5'-nucleotidase C-terminal domain-containing protein, partial [Armatimonadetes bacterium]|nr:5'-nucleotidase C-terminal domain-containing protein [Armatimonadota bacterium]
ERIRQAEFPIVCANVTYKATGKPIVPPYVVLERNGIRIGIFGLTAPRVATYPHAEGLQIEDPIQAAKRVVPILKQESDVVIGLTHIGYGFDKQLAAQVPDIDIIVGGDSHTWLYQPELMKASDTQHAFWVGGPVIVQDGEWGRCLGNLSVVLRVQGEHDYQVMSFKGELLPVNDSIRPSAEIASLLGRYTRPFETVVGECGQTVPKSEMTGWMAEVFRSIGGTQIGVVQVGLCENGIEKGPVTQLDLMKIPAFNNSLVTGQITGEGLRALMSDPSVVVRGIPQSVDSNASYTVCTQDFLAQNVQALKGIAFKSLGKTILDALNEYVTRKDAGKAN